MIQKTYSLKKRIEEIIAHKLNFVFKKTHEFRAQFCHALLLF